MGKRWIKFRKKYLLPRKWRRDLVKKAKTIDVQEPTEIMLKQRECRDKMMEAERRKGRFGALEEKKLEFYKGQVEILDWVLYGSTKDQDEPEDNSSSVG